MMKKLLMAGIFSLFLIPLFVNAASVFGGKTFFGDDPYTFNINLAFLSEPPIWATIFSVMLITLLLSMLTLKVPFFKDNNRAAILFSLLIALLAMTLTPIVEWMTWIGAVSGIIIVLLAIFVILAFIFALLKGHKGEANKEWRKNVSLDKGDKRAKGIKESKSRSKFEKEKYDSEDKDRYKKIARKIDPIKGNVDRISSQADLDSVKKEIDMLRVKIANTKKDDPTEDSDKAIEQLDMAINDLVNGDYGSTKKHLGKAKKILRKHKI